MSIIDYIDIDPDELAKNLINLYGKDEINKTIGRRHLQLSDLKIRTKNKVITSLIANEIQIKYLDSILPGWKKDPTGMIGLREIVLKARQEGLSTIITALMFLDTIQTPNTQTVIIADTIKNTQKIFEMVKRYYNNLPEEYKIPTQYNSKNELYWPSIDSSFFVGTAGTANFGRGGTINNLHGSETAVWPKAEDIISGLMESVPETGNIFIECTANGYGNWFEEEWHLTELYDKSGDRQSVFSPRFFAWFENPEYRVRNTNLTEADLTEEESIRKLTYNLDMEQVIWYRWKEKLLKSKIKQEYPSNPNEAFLLTGTPYFDNEKLDSIKLGLSTEEFNPIPVDIDAEFTHLLKIPVSLSNEEITDSNNDHCIKIWREPEPGRNYIICADVAEGLSQDEVLDSDSADIIDVYTGEQVAHLHGQWDTNEFGWLLGELGIWYNTALIVVERNNHGHSVLNTLINEVEYPLMDGGQTGGVYLHEEYDAKTRLKSRKPGWPTTQKTKYMALEFLKTDIDENEVIINCKDTIKELMRFVKKPGGKAGAAGKGHDDRVISLSIGIAVRALIPQYIGEAVTAEPRMLVKELQIINKDGVSTYYSKNISKPYNPMDIERVI